MCTRNRGYEILTRILTPGELNDLLAKAQNYDSISNLLNVAKIMGDYDDSTILILQSPNKAENFSTLGDTQRGSGFVKQDKFWLSHQRPADSNTLALSARHTAHR
jgi:hypothetical protein